MLVEVGIVKSTEARPGNAGLRSPDSGAVACTCDRENHSRRRCGVTSPHDPAYVFKDVLYRALSLKQYCPTEIRQNTHGILNFPVVRLKIGESKYFSPIHMQNIITATVNI